MPFRSRGDQALNIGFPSINCGCFCQSETSQGCCQPNRSRRVGSTFSHVCVQKSTAPAYSARSSRNFPKRWQTTIHLSRFRGLIIGNKRNANNHLNVDVRPVPLHVRRVYLADRCPGATRRGRLIHKPMSQLEGPCPESLLRRGQTGSQLLQHFMPSRRRRGHRLRPRNGLLHSPALGLDSTAMGKTIHRLWPVVWRLVVRGKRDAKFSATGPNNIIPPALGSGDSSPLVPHPLARSAPIHRSVPSALAITVTPLSVTTNPRARSDSRS